MPGGASLTVLALNSGSSSLKFGLYAAGPSAAAPLITGEADFGGAAGTFRAEDSKGTPLVFEPSAMADQGEAVDRIIRLLADHGAPAPDAIGHRLVHGGPKLRAHCLIDDGVLKTLEAAAAFAPLHIPAALAVIRAADRRLPGLPRVACFDTAFHAAMPPVARVLPIPRALEAEGVQRYGFHGLSCESIVRQLGPSLPARLIIAHLGAGASVTAVRDGVSIDTSMGLTPTGGVIMATRSGDLDPGILLYLMREKGLDAAGLEDLLDRHSGMAGVSGLGGAMRRLIEAAPTSPDARLAIEMFAYSVGKQIAAMIAALGGVDLIVFTGGIGENDAEARAAICQPLNWIGVSLDPARNRAAANPISDPGFRVEVQVLPSREDEEIARHTAALLGGG
jgi:acetate kinase